MFVLQCHCVLIFSCGAGVLLGVIPPPCEGLCPGLGGLLTGAVILWKCRGTLSPRVTSVSNVSMTLGMVVL